MCFKRLIIVGIDIFSYCVTVYAEASIFLNLYSMLGKGCFDSYNLSLMELELVVIVAGVFLDQVIQLLTEKLDILEAQE